MMMIQEAQRICLYCDIEVNGFACPICHEYDGLMTVEEWESYTGEEWEEE